MMYRAKLQAQRIQAQLLAHAQVQAQARKFKLNIEKNYLFSMFNRFESEIKPHVRRVRNKKMAINLTEILFAL